MSKHSSETAVHWANRINRIIDKTLDRNSTRFHVDLVLVVKEISKTLFPDEPITLVKSDTLSNFDGCLVRRSDSREWGIVYNKSVSSKGRIRFTLAHEFGHYLLHRKEYSSGFNCTELEAIPYLRNEYKKAEREANEFASHLLIPKSDFMRQIRPFKVPTLDLLRTCAERYQVSMTATILHWVNYTAIKSVVVASRDNFILWSYSSHTAMRSGHYFKASSVPPIPVPDESLAMRHKLRIQLEGSAITHDPGIWFDEEPCKEVALRSDQHDFVISVLFLESDGPGYQIEEDVVEDAYDEWMRKTR